MNVIYIVTKLRIGNFKKVFERNAGFVGRSKPRCLDDGRAPRGPQNINGGIHKTIDSLIFCKKVIDEVFLFTK